MSTSSSAPSTYSQALIKSLPINEIVGLCQLAANLPVRASDVPCGLGEPSPDEVHELHDHILQMVLSGTYHPDGPEVMGASEVATTLGVQQPNIRTLKGIPKPIGKLTATSLWDAREIRAFA